MDTQFGKYTLARKVGAGGMAEVYLARTAVAQGLAKTLVLKMIHPAYAKSRQFVSMFIDEAKIALGLNHPNIVQVFDFGAVDGTYFLAMEHVEGLDLLRLLQDCAAQGRRISHGLCAYVGQQLCKGLDYAHRKTDEFGDPLGIVHRDISPQNVLLSWDGAVKIVDFGIARARDVHEEEGVIKGKFSYMSPEQARGEPVDCRSDVFAAGIVLYEMVCARPLFPGKGREALELVKAGIIPRPRDSAPHISELLERVLLRALAFDREARYQTARDMQQDLARCMLDWGQRTGEFADSGLLAQFLSTVVPAERRTTVPRPPASGPVAAARAPTTPRRVVAGAGAPGSGVVAPLSDGSGLSIDISAPVEVAPPASDVRDRRYVLVLDGVIRGVPALERRLGATAARKLLADFAQIARDVAYKHDAVLDGGSAQTQPGDAGDASTLRAVVGLPLASEDDADRAIRLGLALIDALDGVGGDVEPELRLAVGVQRGVARVSRATAAAPLAFELEDVTAAIAWRLARQAQGGEILVGGRVYRAARADWQFEALPAIDIPSELDHSGVPTDDETDPGVRRARVYRLRGAKARAERMRERGGLRGSLLGRDLELKAMRDLYREVALGRSKRQLTIVGEAGVGKRALVSAFVAGLPAGEAVVVRATTRIATAMTPFGIVADMARDLLGLAEDAEPHEVERRLLRALPLIYPADGNAEHEREARGALEVFSLLLGARSMTARAAIDADERRARLLQIMLRIERQFAADRVLVLVSEDVHWADEQSQQLFADLLKVPTDRAVLGIMTTRPDASVQGRAQALGSQIMHLPELAPDVARTLVAQRFAPDDDSGELVTQIATRAGGNPAFIHEIFDALVERGVIELDADGPHAGQARWKRRDAQVVVPSSIEDAIATRIDGLPPPLRDALLHAAVLGRGFTAAAVALVLDRPARLELDELAARGLLEATAPGEPDEYRFKNDVAMGVAYRMLDGVERRRLHERTASRLATAPGYRAGQDDAAIARHLELAGDAGRAVERYLRAASHAALVGGNADALRLLARTLRLVPPADHARRFAIHLERAELLGRLGRRQPQLRELHALRREAEALGDVGKLARAHTTLAQFHIDVGRAPAAARAITPAQQFARASGDPLAEAEALRLRAVIARLLGSYDEALRYSAEALQLSDAGKAAAEARGGTGVAFTPALLVRADILGARGETLWATSDLDGALEAFAEALVIYRGVARPRLEARALTRMGVVFAALGEYEEALAHFKRGLALDQQVGDRAGVAAKLADIGQCYGDLGDLARARGYLAKAIALAEQTGDLAAAAAAEISLGQVELAAGDHGAAIERLEQGRVHATASRERYQEIRALEYLALAQLRAGLPATGALELARSATQLAQAMPMPIGVVYGLMFQALALVALRRPLDALPLSRDAMARCQASARADGVAALWRWHASVCTAAGEVGEAATAAAAARAAVDATAARLRDPALRATFLASQGGAT